MKQQSHSAKKKRRRVDDLRGSHTHFFAEIMESVPSDNIPVCDFPQKGAIALALRDRPLDMIVFPGS
ncbi:MAG: hypothetical protein DRP66_00665 [Planctomycetota bacterium]|nr:MAG: hypothetical protein DRP66_00665 [Planctomycetota bacterium]